MDPVRSHICNPGNGNYFKEKFKFRILLINLCTVI